jgi:hypothetical protein
MITVSQTGLTELTEALKGVEKNLSKSLAKAINETATWGKSQVAKKISKELATTQKNIKDNIKAGRASASKLSTKLELTKSQRLSLRHFGARQNKVGVSYKISKTKGRKMVAGAFQGPKPGAMKSSWRGNAFIRVGKSRLPIVKLMGPSPWGVFVKANMVQVQEDELQAEFEKRIKRQVREALLRSQGIIKG